MIDSFSASFPNIPDFKARQFWVSLSETSKGMDGAGSSGFCGLLDSGSLPIHGRSN